jgi:hypothetical protein
MRKFYAAIALCITLIGTFAPVVFSVSTLGEQRKISVQKNVVSADYIDVSFGKPISIVDAPVNSGYYRLETTIRYDGPGATGASFNSSANFGSSSALDPHYQVINTTTGTTVIDKSVSEPEKLGLKDAQYGPMRQDIEITTPGKYEAWFYEDYVTGNNLLSSKIKFEITADKKIINTQISQITINVRGDDQIGFTEITADITEGSDKAKFTIGVTYKNNTKQSTDEVEENLYWSLKDSSGNLVKENAINLNPKPKYNTQRTFSIELPNLEVGKKYTITFIAKDILSTQGNPKTSQEFPFTAGTPVDNDAVQQQIQQDNANAAQQALANLQEQQSGESKKDFECGIIDIFCNIYILIIDFLLFIPNGLTVIAGLFMDISLKIAISPVMYGLTGGLETGLRSAWTMIRDFSNIGFIFALFVAAFSLILNKDIMGFEPKKTVVRVIIMALLVNFSFMMCRVVIQTGDLFANIIYNKITVEGGAEGQVSGISISSLFNALDIKSPSLAIVSQVNPQALFLDSDVVASLDAGSKFSVTGAALGAGIYATVNDVSVLEIAASVGTQLVVEGSQGAAAALLGGYLVGSTKGPQFYITYGIMAVTSFFIYLILIYVFLSSAFIFLGRIVGLWLSIIISPLAFVGNTIPMLSKNKYIGFDNWLNNLVKLSFLTPIFLFFVYLTAVILNAGDLMPFSAGGLVFALIKSLMPAIVAAFLLIQGKKIATEMSGAIGEMVGKVSGWATTAALGAATGGTAMLGRQTLGRAGSALANANRGNNSMLGKGMRNMGDRLGAASFDVRKNERAMKGFGKFTEMSGEKIDLGTRGLREGGFAAEGTLSEQYRKRQERIAKEQEEKLKKEAADALLNAQAKDAQELRENQAKLEAAQKAKAAEDAKIAMEAENQGPEAFIDKKEKEKEALQNQNIQLNVEKLTVESEKTTLNTEKADIENDLNKLETEKTVIEKDIQQLEAAAVVETDPDRKANIEAQVNFQKEDLAKKATEIDNKKVELQNKNIQIQDRDKTIAEKDKEIKKNDEEIKKADTYQNNLTGITSVRDARQKKTDLELEATHSQEKVAMDKNKTDMDERKPKQMLRRKNLNSLLKKQRKKLTLSGKHNLKEMLLRLRKIVIKKMMTTKQQKLNLKNIKKHIAMHMEIK